MRRIRVAEENEERLLDLSGLGLRQLPTAVKNLTHLTRLNLSQNDLDEFPEWVGSFKELQSLNASDNRLEKLPEALAELGQLRKLDLSNNELAELPASIKALKNLSELYLADNRLNALPEEWEELSELHILNLNNNLIRSLPTSMGSLKSLTALDVSFNKLVDLPLSFQELEGLQALSLNDNHFTSLPAWISRLLRLQHLDIRHNRSRAIPEWLGEATQVRDLWLDWVLLPEEQAAIYQKGGWPALSIYLQQLAKSGRDVWMGKLMLVGNGNVGKTCLLDALRGKKPQAKRPTTHGMLREQMHLLADGTLLSAAEREAHPVKADAPIDFHCWDLGGQEDYWNMHQIFFTPSALYVLAYKGRDDIAQGRVREWLTLIRNRATARARVLLVATHAPEKEGVTQPDLAGLEEDLRAMVVDFIPTDSFAGDGIDKLRAALAQEARREDYFKRRLPGGWPEFERVLSGLGQAYVKCETLQKRMDEQGVKQQELLLQVAHDSGLVLWHHHTESLAEYVVLHPDWLSQAIAYVLKYQPAKKMQGLIPLKELSELWAEPPYKESKPYPKTVHAMLLALMEENELSYRVPGAAGTRDGDRELIAQLVETSPAPQVKVRWDAPVEGVSVEMTRLFSFRPPQGRKPQRLTGLVYRLIVRLQEYSLGAQDHEQALHWKNGMLLENSYGDRARIEFRDDDELEIRVKGLIPVGFMDRLTETLKQVVGEFWKGVGVHEMALCGEQCPSGLKSGAFELQSCRADLKEGLEKRRCEVAACGKVVQIISLLAPPPLSRPVQELLVVLYTRFDSVDAQLEAARQKTEELGLQMSAFQQMIRDDIRAVLTNQMDDGHDGPRLFSVAFLEPDFWRKPKWMATTIRVTLCCEHSHCPVPILAKEEKAGVYEIAVTREWVRHLGEWLKFTGKLVLFVKTLGLSGTIPGVAITPQELKSLTEGADTAKKFLEEVKPEGRGYSALPEATPISGTTAAGTPEYGQRIDKEGSFARWLRGQIVEQEKKKKGVPEFAGMQKVNDITGKVLWIHPIFLPHYQQSPARMT